MENLFKQWLDARNRWRHIPDSLFFNIPVSQNKTICHEHGTAEILTYLWDNVESFQYFFTRANIPLNNLLQNPYYSHLLVKWYQELFTIPYLCVIFDCVAKHLHITYNHEIWFNRKIKVICNDLVSGAVVIKHNLNQHMSHEFKLATAGANIQSWKNWYISRILNVQTTSTSEKQKGRSPSPRRGRNPSPRRYRSRSRSASPSKMKKKYKKLLEYKTCTMNNNEKVKFYEYLLQTVEKW